MKTDKYVLFIFSTLAIAVIGYAILHAIRYILPGDNSSGYYFAVTLFITAIGMLAPFWILKAFFLSEHADNPNERKLKLKDLPKDQRQIAKHQ